VFVIDPELLAPLEDPDAFVRKKGVHAWKGLVENRECGIAWRAAEFLRGVTPGAARDVRRDALARAGSWLGTLPPRLALEQEEAVIMAAERCGYSSQAVERAFRARFWSVDGRLSRALRPDLDTTPEL
jgi:hypothetical protein